MIKNHLARAISSIFISFLKSISEAISRAHRALSHTTCLVFAFISSQVHPRDQVRLSSPIQAQSHFMTKEFPTWEIQAVRFKRVTTAPSANPRPAANLSGWRCVKIGSSSSVMCHLSRQKAPQSDMGEDLDLLGQFGGTRMRLMCWARAHVPAPICHRVILPHLRESASGMWECGEYFHHAATISELSTCFTVQSLTNGEL
jgi:hypothetical protein